jgi:hypothetical protein
LALNIQIKYILGIDQTGSGMGYEKLKKENKISGLEIFDYFLIRAIEKIKLNL